MNGRWPSINKAFMGDIDMVFLSETHANVTILEKINGFTIFGDPDIPTPVYHGGLAVHVKDHLSQYVKNLRYGKCSLSFSLSIIPNVFFMGIYVYPIDSLNFDNIGYGVLINDIRYWLEKVISQLLVEILTADLEI